MPSLRSIARTVLPESVKTSLLSSRAYQQRHARKLARSSKRLDICASQISNLLHLTRSSGHEAVANIRGKVCAELGSGWVLSHALVLHLLGAKRVIATDLSQIVIPDALSAAVTSSELSLVRDVLAPFDEYEDIRARLDRIAGIKTLDLTALLELGIEYRAPLDIASEPLGEEVDLWFSHSVMEHVPVSQINGVIAGMAAALNPGGAMIHSIHLEDHRDSAGAPFAFLSGHERQFTATDETNRGNRVRASKWLEMFNETPNLDAEMLFVRRRLSETLPETIDESIDHEGTGDLRASHLGVIAVRPMV